MTVLLSLAVVASVAVLIVLMYTAGHVFLMGTSEGPRRAAAMTVWASYMPVGTAVGLLLAATRLPAGGAALLSLPALLLLVIVALAGWTYADMLHRIIKAAQLRERVKADAEAM